MSDNKHHGRLIEIHWLERILTINGLLELFSENMPYSFDEIVQAAKDQGVFVSLR